MNDRIKLTYIGGGSRFVVTLLHGLASCADALGTLEAIDLVLVDPDTGRAEDMARYARIAAKQTQLPIAAEVTADLDAALEAATGVIFSAGIHGRVEPLRETLGAAALDEAGGEAGPAVALESAAAWPWLREIGEQMRRRCPQATFVTLVNPTDVLAGAFERAFDIRSLGVCVEVGGLIGFLAYYLGVDPSAIELRHVGVNHVGWVSEWTLDGQDGDAVLAGQHDALRRREDWYPLCEFLLQLHEAVGHLRSSAYHHWPYRQDWTDEVHQGMDRWHSACLGDWKHKRDLRRARLAEALDAGRMIAEPDPRGDHPEATSYPYPDTRHVLGALAVGLAGGSSRPVALQVRNGTSNPDYPEAAWLEVPARFEQGRLEPQTVAALPPALARPTVTVAEQRRLLADWLAGGALTDLRRALLSWPTGATLSDHLALADGLSSARNRENT